MKFDVVALRRADDDIRHVFRWIAERSPQGAEAWLAAYEQLVSRLEDGANSCGAALEAVDLGLPLKQALFSTPHSRTYRAVFLIVGRQVRILRIRGPGQPPLQPHELV